MKKHQAIHLLKRSTPYALDPEMVTVPKHVVGRAGMTICELVDTPGSAFVGLDGDDCIFSRSGLHSLVNAARIGDRAEKREVSYAR